jgi:hypothetical protein
MPLFKQFKHDNSNFNNKILWFFDKLYLRKIIKNIDIFLFHFDNFLHSERKSIKSSMGDVDLWQNHWCDV